MQSHKLRDADELLLAVSNDGKLLAATDYEKSDVVIFDTTDFSRPETVLHVGAAIKRISFSPDNSQLLTVDGECVRLWKIDSRECRSFKHYVTVDDAAFALDETRVVSGTVHCCPTCLYFSLVYSW